MTVIFDLDHTILSVNSGSEFLRHLDTLRRIPPRQKLVVVVAAALYRGRLLPPTWALRAAYAAFVGMLYSELQQLARSYARTLLEQFAFREALAAIDEHRAQGQRLVLASGSPEFLVREIASAVGIDDIVATSYRVEDNVVIAVKLPFAFGEGKYARARDAGLVSDPFHVYTDDAIDLPLIRRAALVTVVNPQPRFVRQLHREGIPFRAVQWTCTGSSGCQ